MSDGNILNQSYELRIEETCLKGIKLYMIEIGEIYTAVIKQMANLFLKICEIGSWELAN